ncbi:MAG: class I SAM-dependent methyltransferase [Bacteroidia bacterium]|nr:class I SAM-dependent methyltransferase [Bacteroidia bacterium]
MNSISVSARATHTWPPHKGYCSYTFVEVASCPMCGAPFPEQSRVVGKRLNSSQGLNPREKIGIATTVVRCNGCGLLCASPLPIPPQIEIHYDIPPESYWRDPKIFAISPGYFSREIEMARMLLGSLQGPPRALDIGSGLCKTFYILQQAGFEVWGIEPSPTFREKAIQQGYASEERLKPCSLETAEFPPNYFHFITFSAVLEHLYSPDYALRKALSWLIPGGILHIEVPSARWLPAKLLNIYYRIRGTDYVTHLSPMHPPYHLYEFTPKSFYRHGLRAGYTVAHVEYRPGSVDFLRPLILLLRPLMHLTKTDMQLVVWLRKKSTP